MSNRITYKKDLSVYNLAKAKQQKISAKKIKTWAKDAKPFVKNIYKK